MIRGRDVLPKLGLDIKSSENVIIFGYGKFEGRLAPMFDAVKYDSTYSTDKIFELE